MRMELDERDMEVLKKAESITGSIEKKGNYIDPSDLMGIIDDLLYEIHNLEEKIDDMEKDIEDNYEPTKRSYSYYGISERDFY